MFIASGNTLMEKDKFVASMYNKIIMFDPIKVIYIDDDAYYIRFCPCNANYYYCPGEDVSFRVNSCGSYIIDEDDILYQNCVKILELKHKVDKSFERALCDTYQFRETKNKLRINATSSYHSIDGRNILTVKNESFKIEIQVSDSEELFNAEETYAASILDQLYTNAARCLQKSAR